MEPCVMEQRETGRRPAHSAAIRVMHWIGVYAMGCMIFSGWEIYNASPSLPFLFPAWTGLGGWLCGALAWHLSAMWLLFASPEIKHVVDEMRRRGCNRAAIDWRAPSAAPTCPTTLVFGPIRIALIMAPNSTRSFPTDAAPMIWTRY